MNIYTPYPNCDDYDCFYPLDQQNSHDILSRFLNFGKYQNTEEKCEWIPLPVGIESLGTKRGDFLAVIACSFACNKKAWELLEPLIGNDVKLLPLACSDGEFNILKVTNIIDCLEHSKIDALRSEETGRILHIRTHVFKEDMIKNQHFFAIPEKKFGILVSQDFKDLVEENGLEGLGFRQIA
jgi:hypothetical protein